MEQIVKTLTQLAAEVARQREELVQLSSLIRRAFSSYIILGVDPPASYED